ncbi:M50 family metallopeptidase [Paenibacillus doosanensis]|uniref:Stage IV sporulation protein FB n=1 Tax=Paenibacillus konkukensis TaxID=2020716 RepID=A0ABY4RYM4_9BACL|nr:MULTISPECIES: M50 family metallopeptidase [Paenibacillus]MCS7458719.1 M50 family metallopeptidase [Paenibacillus doosanensis]UQZ86756.1 Stage IV sporulation protein FB [Paenibacillus konkukensis]
MIKWGSLFGVRLRFHPLFSIVILLSVLAGYFIETATLFVIVLVHEWGHVVAAKNFGWRVKEVQLLPFGGVAVVEEMASVPVWQEIIVTVSGPLQNGMMIVAAFALQSAGFISGEWGAYFIQANVFVALFNLLPILPLDGGKLMQSLLSLWLPYQRVIALSCVVSLVFSGLMIAASVLHMLYGGLQMNLLMIGLFLFYSNWYAYKGLSYHFMRFLIHRENSLNRLMNSGTLARPIVVHGKRKVTDIVRLFMREKYHLVYVMDERGTIRVVLPEQPLLQTYFNESKRGSAISELFM